jgi:hypothetical protein
MLGAYHVFEFDAAAAPYTNSKHTTPEIRALCEDLKVLGKSDFKRLLAWRFRMLELRKELKKVEHSPCRWRYADIRTRRKMGARQW